MKFRHVVLCVITLAASAVSVVTAQDLTAPTVNVYRVLQIVDDSATTVVEGMFRVDPALLGSAACDYSAEVQVKNAHGASLRDDKWDAACPIQDGAPVAALETFRFGMPAGQTYTVEITVHAKDKPKERHMRTLKVKSLDNAFVSDLILARQVGLIDSTKPMKWTIKRGSLGIRTASETVVEPGAENVSYYVELYPHHARPMSGMAIGIVRRTDGAELVRFQLQTLDHVTNPQPIAGKANLAGLKLAPGMYNFEVQLALNDTTITLSQPFEMLAAAAPAPAAGSAAPGYFSTVSDEDMQRKYSAASVWLTQKAQSEVFNSLTPSGKREYLNQYFGPEMPTPNDGRESSNIDRFVSRADAVDKRYSEKSGRGQQDGWHTDRGRIYMLHGEPNNLVRQPSPRSGAPYEIFFYQVGKGLAYVFGDDTRMGHYRLIWTNDPNEQGVGGLTRVGPEALEDLQRLGVRITGNQ